MLAFKSNSIDAIITDPPYNLHFMGKAWDKDLLHEKWLTQAYRVMKPGASMLVMGGTRTFHRLACAIEDTGFIIKDTLMWIYGSGFPKAQELANLIRGKSEKTCKDCNGTGKTRNSKAKEWEDYWLNIPCKECKGTGKIKISNPKTKISEHWDGFKIGGVKPAYEPIIWAVKPPEGSYIDNVLKWGVGAVNVDECRIEVSTNDSSHRKPSVDFNKKATIFSGKRGGRPIDNLSTKGRFPANIILDEEAGKVLDEMSGALKSGQPAGIKAGGQLNCYGVYAGGIPVTGIGDSGGASRFFYCAKASRGERNLGLEGMEERELGHNRFDKCATCGGYMFQNPDRKSACKCEQPQREHNKTNGNFHPTVKPISLMSWLIKLVTREGQVVLDPFLGSGTTGISAHESNRKFVGIEQEAEYIEIDKKRIEYFESQPQLMEMGE